jgi:GABA(A) receptor-associated protein
MSNYRALKSQEDRVKESSRVLKKYPDSIPVICGVGGRGLLGAMSGQTSIEKIVVPKDTTFQELITVIRERQRLESHHGFFLSFEDGTSPLLSMQLMEAYENNKSEDGFLYINYVKESVFG